MLIRVALKRAACPALPARWRVSLLGRTTLDDDGRVFRLIESAVTQVWGSSPG